MPGLDVQLGQAETLDINWHTPHTGRDRYAKKKMPETVSIFIPKLAKQFQINHKYRLSCVRSFYGEHLHILGLPDPSLLSSRRSFSICALCGVTLQGGPAPPWSMGQRSLGRHHTWLWVRKDHWFLNKWPLCVLWYRSRPSLPESTFCSFRKKTTYLILDPGFKVGLYFIVPILSSLNISVLTNTPTSFYSLCKFIQIKWKLCDNFVPKVLFSCR